MINCQDWCSRCLKVHTCSWYEKLSKLRGTNKNPILLDILVEKCEEFVLNPDIEPEEE